MSFWIKGFHMHFFYCKVTDNGLNFLHDSDSLYALPCL